MKYADGAEWKTWMRDYNYGTFAFIPGGDLLQTVNALRGQFDPVAAQTCVAHVSLTQPLISPVTPEQLRSIESVIRSFRSFRFEVGPVTTSPNKRLLWLDVSGKETIVKLRDALHNLGLFRTDLPLTKGFIPHMTISEAGRDPAEVSAIISDLNMRINSWTAEFDAVSWIIPDQNFVFQEYHRIHLSQ